MPKPQERVKMFVFEEAVLNAMKQGDVFMHVYTKTGNNLKEFVFYTTKQDAFMQVFNEALKNHKPYPITVHFYKDKAWRDLKFILGRGA